MSDRNEDRVTIEVDRDARMHLKVLASLEGISMCEYVTWMAAKAYEAKLHNSRRK